MVGVELEWIIILVVEQEYHHGGVELERIIIEGVELEWMSWWGWS